MNVAALARIKVISGTASALIQTVKENTHGKIMPGHLETAIYLSAIDPQEIFILSFWQGLADLPDSAAMIENLNAQFPATTQSVLVENNIFTLVKDYRKVSATIKASHIRILTVSVGNPKEWLKQLADVQLIQAKTLPGLVGGWLGRSIDSDLSSNNKLVLLNRVDWASLEEQQAFFKREEVRETLHNFVATGARIEFASSDLRGLILQNQD